MSAKKTPGLDALRRKSEAQQAEIDELLDDVVSMQTDEALLRAENAQLRMTLAGAVRVIRFMGEA